MRLFFPHLSLRTKATALLLAVVMLTSGFSATAIILDTNRHIAADQREAAESIAIGLGHAVELSLAVGDTDEMNRLAKGVLQHGDTSFVAIINAGGKVVASAAKSDALFAKYQTGKNVSDQVIIAEYEVVLVPSADQLSALSLGADKPASSQPASLGRVVVGVSTDSMIAAQQSQTSTVLSTTLVAVVVLGAAVFLGVGGWTRRLQVLVHASDRITHGRLDQPVDADHDDEIGKLSAAFENMRLSLVERERERDQFNQMLQQKIEDRTRDLKAALFAAEAAARAKSEFLANMSHEIRTPMTAILGYADMLLDVHQSPSDRVNCIQTIRRNGEHLLVIINDILDISKIEAGKMVTERINCSPVQIAEETLSLMQVRAQEQQTEVHVSYEGLLPGSISSDPTRIRQILMNLVGNAIKFSPKGSVTLAVKLERESSVNYNLVFNVIDTGVGMTEDQMDRLFQPFMQADTSMTRRFGGTGLGLTISKRLATLLGGDITAQSTPGRGSTFTLTIPVGDLANAELKLGEAWCSKPGDADGIAPVVIPKDVSKPLAGVRILVAEDGPDNQRLILYHLHKAGAAVDLVENGQLAVDRIAEAGQSGTPYDVVLMDMQMPVMDGYAATLLLRSRHYTGPIIALTAHAMAGDREKCLSCGCSDYITKPIHRQHLIEACLRGAMASRQDGEEPGRQAA